VVPLAPRKRLEPASQLEPESPRGMRMSDELAVERFEALDRQVTIRTRIWC
jgi:hypothetical protein